MSTTNTLFLICAALLPAIVLCVYVFIKDRAEKEPIGLLLLLLFCGGLSCFPAAEIENWLLDVIASVFATSQSDIGYSLYIIAENFVGIALVEEACKFFMLCLVTKNSKHFNSFFDGIIYAVFVSLGFAALENILYVTSYGFSNAILRAITAVPGHMFFGVLMGYYYSMAHMHKKAAEHETSLLNQNYIRVSKKDMFSEKPFMIAALAWSTLAHGFYDYCCSVGSDTALLIFIGFLAFLYFYCFKKIKKTSAGDKSDMQYAFRLIIEKYPGLLDVIKSKN